MLIRPILVYWYLILDSRHRIDRSCNISGLEWHSTLKTEEHLISPHKLPHCIIDSYEECRGPPQLYLLDKYIFSRFKEVSEIFIIVKLGSQVFFVFLSFFLLSLIKVWCWWVWIMLEALLWPIFVEEAYCITTQQRWETKQTKGILLTTLVTCLSKTSIWNA